MITVMYREVDLAGVAIYDATEYCMSHVSYCYLHSLSWPDPYLREEDTSLPSIVQLSSSPELLWKALFCQRVLEQITICFV